MFITSNRDYFCSVSYLDNIRRKRLSSGLSAAFVAANLEMSHKSYNRREKGEVDFTFLEILELKKILNMSFNDICEGQETVNEPISEYKVGRKKILIEVEVTDSELSNLMKQKVR